MVGVPRSTGCHLCIKRRVKCDQSRPGCGNCAKYGADCPGYDRSFKFVAGKHQVRNRRQRPAPSDDGVVEVPREDDNCAVELYIPSSSILSVERRTITPFTITPRDSRGQFVSALLQNIDYKGPTSGLRIFTPWFKNVAQRLGKSMTLDTAMSALVLQLLGKAKEENTMVQHSRSIYGQCLGLLQNSLNHPVAWRSPETLCTTMLLCFFELFAGTVDADSWMQHAAGVSWLIQQRGPGAYSDEWDWSMLHSFRPIMIMNCMFTSQDCFLSRKRWEKLLYNRPSGFDTVLSQTGIDWVHDDYMTPLAKMPAILREGRKLRDANNHNMPVDAAYVAQLLRRAETLRATFVSWHDRFEKLDYGPIEVPSQDPSSLYETVLSYSNVWAGGMYMSYWATMLILQETLNQCQYPIDYSESNHQLVRNILRSVETVAADVMGPYRIGYSIRIAYEFADIRAQAWVTSLLVGFQKRYAAVSAEKYPEPAANEYQYS